MEKPRLKRHYSVVAHSPDTAELRSGVWRPVSITLTDEHGSGHLLRMLRRLDGEHSLDDIAAAEGVPRSSVEALVDRLAEANAIETQANSALEYYLEQISSELQFQERRPGLKLKRAVVIGDSIISHQIISILQSSGLRDEYAVESGDPGLRSLLLRSGASWTSDSLAFEEETRPFAEWQNGFAVFGVSSVNPLEARALNRISLRYRIPWMHAAVDGPCLLVGPTFIPFRSACFECLETRFLMNMREGASYQRYKYELAAGRVSGAALPLDALFGALLSSLAAYETANFMLTGTNFTAGKMLSLYLPTMEFAFHDVMRMPGCPACGPEPARDDEELYFDMRALGGSSSAKRED